MVLAGKEDSIMPSSTDETRILQNLSPSARAVLQALCKLENGEQVVRFQQGHDQALDDLKRWVNTYRGGFCKAVKKRIRQVLSRGGIIVITQDDIIGLIHDLWSTNISKLSLTELKVLEGTLRNPVAGVIELAKKIGLTYARTRRAKEHLQMTGVLQRKGCFNVAPLGLDRILIRLENPTYVPVSPYFEKTLFIDHPRIVLVVGATPSGQRRVLEQTIKSLRTVSDSVTIWRLSIGQPSFRNAYYNKSTKQFTFDPFHFRLSLADEEAFEIVVNPMLTGRFKISHRSKKPTKSDVFALRLKRETLWYNDRKQMGRVYLVRNQDYSDIAEFMGRGPSALDPKLTLDEFKKRLLKHRGQIKNVLRNQKFVKGIGNAYIDEILLYAGILPFRKKASLSDEEVSKLFESMRTILGKFQEILFGRTIEEIGLEKRDFMMIHGKGNDVCPLCGNRISEVKANRFKTNYCQKSQV